MNLSNLLTGAEVEPITIFAEVPLHSNVGFPEQSLSQHVLYSTYTASWFFKYLIIGVFVLEGHVGTFSKKRL
jgi:hypothetical protein